MQICKIACQIKSLWVFQKTPKSLDVRFSIKKHIVFRTKTGLRIWRILTFWSEIDQSVHVIGKWGTRAFECLNIHHHIFSRLEAQRQNIGDAQKRGFQKRNGESFGGRCPTTTVEGVISWIWAITKIFIWWQCDPGHMDLEYFRSHSLFKSASEEGSKTRGKSGVNIFGLKRRWGGCWTATSRRSPTSDSNFWWRTEL